jgi:hypothetical protein
MTTEFLPGKGVRAHPHTRGRKTVVTVVTVVKTGFLQPIDLLRLLLDVNAQLVAVLLLDLLVAELFGLVQSAIELRNQTLSPTLRQRAFFLGLVLPGYFTLVVWRLNPHCALWHLYSSTPSPNIRQKNFVLVSPIISQGNSRLPAQLSTQIFAFNATAPTLFFAPFREYYRERI